MYGHHPRYTADNDAAETDVHNAHVNSFSYLLWAGVHFGCQVWEYLTTTYNDRWIGQGEPIASPARSLDLTPMDFFLWGHIKALIYTFPVVSEEDLIACIVVAATTWHFWAHVTFCCIGGCVSRSMTVHLNSCSKLVWNTTFFQNTSVVLLNI